MTPREGIYLPLSVILWYNKHMNKQEKKRLSNRLDYQKHREKRIETQRRYKKSLTPEQKQENSRRDRDRHALRKYGITEEMYHDMCTEQGDMCCICKRHKNDIPIPDKPKQGQRSRAFVIDHCHETHKVRGLLCVKCNTALGGFNDDIELLRTAIEYLQG